MKTYTLMGFAVLVGATLAAGPLAAQTVEPDDYDEPGAMDEDFSDPEFDTQDQDDSPPIVQSPDPEPTTAPGVLDTPYEPLESASRDDRDHLLTPFGMGLTIGGGANGFTDPDFVDNIEIGGGWEARVIFGTRSPVALEAAYQGTANKLNTFGLDDNAFLLSNGLEADLRLNVGTADLQPYVLAGAGWKHYSLQNTDTNTSSLNDSDNVLEVPLGVGFSYSFNRFIADVRGTWRPAFNDDLIRSDATNSDDKLHTWRAGANLGFEF